jgi:hypothetical protein
MPKAKDPEKFQRSADLYIRNIQTDLPVYDYKTFKVLAESRVKSIINNEKRKGKEEQERKEFLEKLTKYGI